MKLNGTTEMETVEEIIQRERPPMFVQMSPVHRKGRQKVVTGGDATTPMEMAGPTKGIDSRMNQLNGVTWMVTGSAIIPRDMKETLAPMKEVNHSSTD
tara:strand:- start:103 stop:396 length:294 start_codon:yes stop_codon:yes gene_type:complete